MSNLFDFNDVSDLSEELRKRLAGGGRVNPNIAIYANIVKAGAAAGAGALSISMIEGVAERMELPKLSQQSIRNALVAGVTAGLIQKTTRQTYGVIKIAVENSEAEVSENPPMDVTDSPDENPGPVECTTYDPLA